MKMKFVLLLLLGISAVSCQSSAKRKQATIVFYNVENLFDTVDDPHKNDNDFLPESDKQWTTERYQKKLDDIATVLTNINPDELPEVIGLCEIENLTVLNDLAKTKAMSKGNYRIVHQDSPDERGIDVALFYRPTEFKLISHETLTVNPGFKTRDILHVYGQLGGDKIHFFVNHWPSRIGGLDKTEPNRMAAAQVLKNKVDELLARDPGTKIIIMGDMNDEPGNASLLSTLGAKAPESNAGLTNLMFPLKEKKLGSYNYRSNWNMLDNLIVSNSVLNGKGFVTTAPGFIFREEWIEYKNKNGTVSPNRTYGGPNYYGGVSDHFPVYLKLSR
ncbi:MAG: endonuclease/exonuclease/phosphatase family protein [Mangrovibacterium sp.]